MAHPKTIIFVSNEGQMLCIESLNGYQNYYGTIPHTEGLRLLFDMIYKHFYNGFCNRLNRYTNKYITKTQIFITKLDRACVLLLHYYRRYGSLHVISVRSTEARLRMNKGTV